MTAPRTLFRKVWDRHVVVPETAETPAVLYIDLHLILPREMTLEDAHREADDLEKAILAEVPGAESVLVHMDPCQKENCPICGRAKCRHRAQPFRQTSQWNTTTMTATAFELPQGR